LHHHLIFIGTQTNIGGIGHLTILSIMDSIIGIDLDFMDSIIGIDTIVGDGDMDIHSIITMVGEMRWTIMHGKTEIEEMLLI